MTTDRELLEEAWTDYPFEVLGDSPYTKAPVRKVKVLSFDGNKYCRVEVCGEVEEIKAGYIYQKEGRYGEVPAISIAQLEAIGKEMK